MTDPHPRPGSLFVVAAPSGAGKTSLVRALLADAPLMQLSVSFTTRPPRPGEVDGRDYFFVDAAGFERRREAGEFLEWAEVHGNLYATSRAWIEDRIEAGVDIVLEIDWQGAVQVQRLFPDAIGIFVVPPSIGVLRERLTQRGQDSAEVIERRVAAAEAELKQAHRFQYVIINQDFASALGDLRTIVEAARLRFTKQQARHPATFAALGIAKRKQV
ncbi:MAG: guanylate kinase [Burkholderiaceae bacterium]|nr:guanylate kinase [Burkholderiaceae bacterium]